MNSPADFLARLADRHLGTASAIQPRLPSLFEAEQGQMEAAMPAAPGPVRQVPPSVAPSERRPAPEPEPVPAQVTKPAASRDAAMEPQVQAAAAPVRHNDAAMAPRPALTIQFQPPAPAGVAAPAPSGRAAAVPMDERVRPASQPVAAQSAAAPSAPLTRQLAGMPTRQQPTLPAGVLNPAPAVEGLLPQWAPMPGPQAPRRARSAAAAEPRPVVAQAPEVHISIGRFEVRAESAAPAPDRNPPRRAAPMSLDDYFKRNGAGS